MFYMRKLLYIHRVYYIDICCTFYVNFILSMKKEQQIRKITLNQKEVKILFETEEEADKFVNLMIDLMHLLQYKHKETK